VARSISTRRMTGSSCAAAFDPDRGGGGWPESQESKAAAPVATISTAGGPLAMPLVGAITQPREQ
jgi:hypothetical protein